MPVVNRKKTSQESPVTNGVTTMSSDSSTSLIAANPSFSVDESPDIPDGLVKEHPASPFSRLFFWGPLIAMGIIAYISATTAYFTMMWWPLNSIDGAVHFTIFMVWNYLTLTNLTQASVTGPGYVPRGWVPPEESHKQQLQFCDSCEGYKAPRSHHCSQCKRCCMKMDHHCPWINNCVGHANHAYFVRFLIFAIVGCAHATVILCFSFYHALHLHWYLRYGNGSEPFVEVSFASFIVMVAASALAFGVIVGLSVLLYMQLKYIVRNMTGIEEYIDKKAAYYDHEEGEEYEYPYNLGWKRNVREVLGSFSGRTNGNGVWWPVRSTCDQFTLTREQLKQKEIKRQNARFGKVNADFSGSQCDTMRLGCKAFFCQPIFEGVKRPVKAGDEWIVTRGTKHWVYGHSKSDEKYKGWIPKSKVDVYRPE